MRKNSIRVLAGQKSIKKHLLAPMWVESGEELPFQVPSPGLSGSAHISSSKPHLSSRVKYCGIPRGKFCCKKLAHREGPEHTPRSQWLQTHAPSLMITRSSFTLGPCVPVTSQQRRSGLARGMWGPGLAREGWKEGRARTALLLSICAFHWHDLLSNKGKTYSVNTANC